MEIVARLTFVGLIAVLAGCGGGLSEKEVREIVVESSAAIQADYRAEIKRGDDANYEEERAVRQEEVLGRYSPYWESSGSMGSPNRNMAIHT